MERTSECREFTRRESLQIVLQGGMVLVGFCAAGSAVGSPPTWEAVGNVAQFAPRVPRRVALKNGTTIYVVRHQNGTWQAVSTRCTHSGAEVHWDGTRQRFVCPAHGATFTIDGAKPTGPARSPLARLPAKSSGKKVVIDTASPAAAAARMGGRKGTDKQKHHDEHKEHGDGEKHEEHEGRDRGHHDTEHDPDNE